MKIGVFDSGVGGLSIANALQKGLPKDEIIFVNDVEHVPYGDKAPEQLLEWVEPILQGLVEQGCEIIVIACNTVSTTLASTLRERFSVPLVALEPMVKPAAEQTKTGVIAVCATPNTLKSTRYAWLKDTYAKDVTVLEPDCADWAEMIEGAQLEERKIRVRIEEVLEQKADIIVLGCTHYHWIEDEIKQMVAGRAAVIQPEDAIVRRVKTVQQQLA